MKKVGEEKKRWYKSRWYRHRWCKLVVQLKESLGDKRKEKDAHKKTL